MNSQSTTFAPASSGFHPGVPLLAFGSVGTALLLLSTTRPQDQKIPLLLASGVLVGLGLLSTY